MAAGFKQAKSRLPTLVVIVVILIFIVAAVNLRRTLASANKRD
jgi:hypothetical protein